MLSKKMKKIAVLATVAISVSVWAEESNVIYKCDWNDKNLGTWEVHPEKKDSVKLNLKTENENETRLEIETTGEWCPCIMLKNIFLEGAKKISFDINPGTDFEWLKITVVLQSSVVEWDVIGEKELQKGDKWQNLVFDIDSGKHKGAGWNQIVIIANSDKKGKFLIDNLKILK